MSKIHPQNIKSTQQNFSTLKEELIHIHNKNTGTEGAIDSIQVQLESIVEEVEGILPNIGGPDATAVIQEVTEARGSSESLKDKILELESRQIEITDSKLSYTKTIENNENGFPSRIIYSGDIDQEVRYIYLEDNPDVLTREEYYYNGTLNGSIDYIYDLIDGEYLIKSIVNNKADTFNIASDSVGIANLSNEIALLRDAEVLRRIDELESNSFSGIYNGRDLYEMVTTFNSRVSNLETVAFGTISDIVNLPALLRRIEDIEASIGEVRNFEEFLIVSSTDEYTLNGIVNIKSNVIADGLKLFEGLTNDYIVLEDKKTIKFLTSLLPGVLVRCEYY